MYKIGIKQEWICKIWNSKDAIYLMFYKLHSPLSSRPQLKSICPPGNPPELPDLLYPWTPHPSLPTFRVITDRDGCVLVMVTAWSWSCVSNTVPGHDCWVKELNSWVQKVNDLPLWTNTRTRRNIRKLLALSLSSTDTNDSNDSVKL